MLTSLDLIVLVSYLGGMVAIGFWFARQSSHSEEFMAAGRSLPGWVVGLSIFGTFVSSISFLANPGKSYDTNWNAFAFSLSLPLAAWVATKWFVPFYRNNNEISAYSHLENRFGPWARTYAVVCFILTQIARMGTIMYLVALALHPLTGWDVRIIILITGLLVTFYTLLGGIEAVIWTDAVQSIVLTGGIILSITVLVFSMPEGPSQLFTIAIEKNKFSLGSFGTALNAPTFWIVLTYGLFINLQNFGIDQAYVQRYITAKTDRDAKRSVWIGAMLYIPISALLFFIGTALFAFYNARPELLITDTGADLKPDAIFPHFIAHQLPSGVTGILIAAILAAAMSSVDSSLNCCSTLVLQDIYKRYVNPNPTEQQAMRILYWGTLAWGIVGTGTALAMIRISSALDVWWKLAGIFSGGMLGLFLLGMISNRPSNRVAKVAVAISVAIILWMSLTKLFTLPESLKPFQNPLHDQLTIVVGTLSILILGFALTAMFPRRKVAVHQNGET